MNDETPLGEVREQVVATAWEEATECPVCFSNVKVYRWAMYATAVRWLEALYALGGTAKFVDYQDLKAELSRRGVSGTSETTRLRLFGLAETSMETRPEGVGRGGEWRCTANGERYLQGSHSVQRAVHVLHGTPLLWEEGTSTVFDADPKFDLTAHLAPTTTTRRVGNRTVTRRAREPKESSPVRSCTRVFPPPVAHAPAAGDLRRHEPKPKRGSAQSKKPVQQVRRDPTPKLTGDALQDYLDKKAGL